MLYIYIALPLHYAIIHKLMLKLCPSLTRLFCSFPSRFVIGRSRGEAMADRRKDELNAYVWHLIHSANEVAQVLCTSYFHQTLSVSKD